MASGVKLVTESAVSGVAATRMLGAAAVASEIMAAAAAVVTIKVMATQAGGIWRGLDSGHGWRGSWRW